jgi:hypothetical protein
MSEAQFPAHISAALDRLTVPPLPTGFAERLVARIVAGDLPNEALGDLPPLPAPRRPMSGARRWLRPGRVIAGVALLGVTTATAAASGVFGDPVYVPVVSEVLDRANVVEMPVRVAPVTSKPAAALPPQTKVVATGTEAVRQMYERLRADEEFRALPPRERAAVARAELDEMLKAGTIKPGDIRDAMAAAKAARSQQEQQRIAKEIAKLKEAAERRERYRNAGPDEQAAMREEQRLRNAQTQDKIRAAYDALPAADQKRLRELRDRVRVAPPAERPAIRREIRRILRKAGQNAAPAEGNPESPR